MKVLAVLAIANAAVAAASAFASAAPLPGALLLFALWVPLAAFFAANNQTIAALCVPLFALLAFAVSPLEVKPRNYLPCSRLGHLGACLVAGGLVLQQDHTHNVLMIKFEWVNAARLSVSSLLARKPSVKARSTKVAKYES